MNEIDVYQKMNEIVETPQFSLIFGDTSEQTQKIMAHREWLKGIRHERPNPEVPFKVGIYIRYFNQTKYENYVVYIPPFTLSAMLLQIDMVLKTVGVQPLFASFTLSAAGYIATRLL